MLAINQTFNSSSITMPFRSSVGSTFGGGRGVGVGWLIFTEWFHIKGILFQGFFWDFLQILVQDADMAPVSTVFTFILSDYFVLRMVAIASFFFRVQHFPDVLFQNIRPDVDNLPLRIGSHFALDFFAPAAIACLFVLKADNCLRTLGQMSPRSSPLPLPWQPLSR